MNRRQRALRALARQANAGNRAAARQLNRQVGPAAARTFRANTSGS